MKETIRVRDLKAYSVCFIFESKGYADEAELHKITVIAHNNQEAEDIFKKYAIAKNLLHKINYIGSETQLKSKSNKHMINKEFYIKQNAYVNELFEKFNNKQERNK